MPLIKTILKSQIDAKLAADPKLKAGILGVSTKAMNAFQLSCVASLASGGNVVTAVASQAAASAAFANEMKALQPFIAAAVAAAVSDAVDSYVKGAQVIITPPLTSTPAAIGAPVLIPVIPPGKLI